MAWRRAAGGPAAGAVAELEGYAERYAAAAGRGDRWAAERLVSVLSWIAMLRAAGGDREIADLFLEFARADRGGVAQAH
jgi:hypothetical protein